MGDASDAVDTDKGDSQDAQAMRYLENSYDKVTMKTEEAKQVQRVYLDIKNRFEVEAQQYPCRLDAMEADIRNTRTQLKELKAMFFLMILAHFFFLLAVCWFFNVFII